MNLHITHPHAAINFHLGIEEIGSGIGVEQTGVNHPHLLTGVGDHILRPPQSVIPHILHQFFHAENAVHCAKPVQKQQHTMCEVTHFLLMCTTLGWF